MPASIIQAQYETLNEIADHFKQQSELTTQQAERLRRVVEGLQDGGWIGRGAEAFFSEMKTEVLPATQRLSQALQVSQSTMLQIAQILREAEEEAARLFGQSREENLNHSHERTVPDYLPPEQIFNSAYMNQFVGTQIQGENSQALNEAMRTLMDDHASSQEIDRALHQLAETRGVSYENMQAQYDRLIDYKGQITVKARSEGKDTPWAGDLPNPDFIGSQVHLRFGRVVGDALGLDPALAAMLNPTGGMVGPGDIQLYPPIPEHPLTYHGIFHDAGGFLYNNLGIGPGYNYLGHESWRNPSSPLTGQEAGILYWNGYWTATNGVSLRTVEGTFHSVIGIGAGALEDIYELPGDIYNAAQDIISLLPGL